MKEPPSRIIEQSRSKCDLLPKIVSCTRFWVEKYRRWGNLCDTIPKTRLSFPNFMSTTDGFVRMLIDWYSSSTRFFVFVGEGEGRKHLFIEHLPNDLFLVRFPLRHRFFLFVAEEARDGEEEIKSGKKKRTTEKPTKERWPIIHALLIFRFRIPLLSYLCRSFLFSFFPFISSHLSLLISPPPILSEPSPVSFPHFLFFSFFNEKNPEILSRIQLERGGRRIPLCIFSPPPAQSSFRQLFA